jgi:hypothetical protein
MLIFFNGLGRYEMMTTGPVRAKECLLWGARSSGEVRGDTQSSGHWRRLGWNTHSAGELRRSPWRQTELGIHREEGDHGRGKADPYRTYVQADRPNRCMHACSPCRSTTWAWYWLASGSCMQCRRTRAFMASGCASHDRRGWYYILALSTQPVFSRIATKVLRSAGSVTKIYWVDSSLIAWSARRHHTTPVFLQTYTYV